MNAELTIRHLGRKTRATVRGGDAQLKKFRDALLLKEFRLSSERDGRLELGRRAFLLQEDWPMWVSIRRENGQFQIDYWNFIPWGWIIGLVFLILVVLPFAGIPNEILMFSLAAIITLLAVYKQKFDCRPDARFWQQQPRQRWGEVLEQMLKDSFNKK